MHRPGILKRGITTGLLIAILILAFGSTELSKASELSYGRIEGSINDPSGRAHWIHVTAFLLHTPDGYPVFTMTCHTFTDVEGNYSCPAVPSGHYIILAYPSHTANISAQDDMPSPTFYPGTTDIDEAELVRARPNTLNVFNMYLAEESLFQVSGHIKHRPKSAAFMLYRVDKARAFKLISGKLVKYEPATGTFTVDGIPDGQYLLAGNWWYFDSASRRTLVQEKAKMGSVAITVAGSNVSNALLKPESLTTVDGQVNVDGAIPGRTLHLVLQSADAQQRYETTIHPDGVFRLNDLPCGRYRISDLNLPGAYVQSVELGNLSPTSGQLVIPNDPRVHVEINMRRHARTISGTVPHLNPGTPHAYVLAKNELTGNVKITESNRNGQFEVVNLSPGQYDLYAWTSLKGVAYETEYGLRQYEADKVVVATDEEVPGEAVVVPLITRSPD